MSNPLYDALFGRYVDAETPFIEVPDGRVWSHGAFVRLAARMSNVLKNCGVSPGDRVAAVVPKSAEALALYAACVQAGAVFLPLNTAYTAAELTYFIEDSGARLLVCDPGREVEIAAVVVARIETLAGDGSGRIMEMAGRQGDRFETVARGADDLAAILYTSGTTGRSKGAMLSQRNLLSNAQVLTEAWRFTETDVLLHALPIFHTHGLFVATNICLIAGCRMILYPGFDLNGLIADMPRATALMGVPTFYTRLLGDARFDAEVARNMRLFVSGSAPLLAETHRQFEARVGHRILERYGMTETNMSTSNPYEGERRAGTVGRALPGVEVKVCDAEGAELPDGEIGTLEVRGPNVFRGYWRMPEKTAEELRPDGFFVTGDLAVKDADGYVTIVGRGKDLIISGGLNVYPKEVEAVLDDQPGVLESAVIGVPHGDFGEAVVAVVVPEVGVVLDTAALKDATAEVLATFKLPREVVLVDTLPRNTMGKVQKAALRDAHAGLFSRA